MSTRTSQQKFFRTAFRNVNVEAFQAVKKRIQNDPASFDMDWFGIKLDKCYKEILKEEGEKAPTCNTVACIAGWALANEHLKTHKTLKGLNFERAEFEAPDLLGLTYDEAEIVFYEFNWPTQFCRRYEKAYTRREKAFVAIDFIDWICNKTKKHRSKMNGRKHQQSCSR